MTETEQDEITYVLHQLSDVDPDARCRMLRIVRDAPTSNSLVRARVEQLIGDTAPCLISIPLEFGEVRWMAAQALAAERAITDISDTVRLFSVAAPLNVTSLARLVRRAGIIAPRTNNPLANSIAELEALLRTGELPLYDVEFGERGGYIDLVSYKQINPEITIPDAAAVEPIRRDAKLVASCRTE